MGRLTKINEDACQLCKADYCIEKEPCFLYEVYDKLAHYEDMEEQGRLIKYDTNQYGVMKMPKSNATLKAMTKVELIEYIRILEHDYNVAVDFNERQARNIEAKLKELEGDKE